MDTDVSTLFLKKKLGPEFLIPKFRKKNQFCWWNFCDGSKSSEFENVFSND